MLTTVGREIIREKLPDKYKHYCDTPLTAGVISQMCTEMALDNPDAYIDTLQDLNAIGEDVVSTYGREASLSMSDLKQSAEIAKLNEMLRGIVRNVLNNRAMTEKQKEDKIRELGYKYSDRVQKMVLDDANRRKTALAAQINSKSRGNPVQLMQLQVGNMLMKDALGRDIPYLMIDGYAQGASPTAYWISASSGRRGFYLTQFATGQAGYMGKQVTNITHDTIISEDDCGTTNTGVPFPAGSPKNVGAVLLKPFHDHPAGSIVTPDMVAEADDDEEMILRSPMTCKAKHGVCRKCSGLDENGKFPGIGEYVSLNAARTFVEKITQGGISCLHPGTLVRMADWSVKRISDIKIGDRVMGCSTSGTLAPAAVTNVFDNGIQDVWVYGFRKPDNSLAVLLATQSHKVLKAHTNSGKTEIARLGALTDADRMVFPHRENNGKFNVLDLLRKETSKHLGWLPTMDIEIDNDSHLFLLANGLVVSNSKHGAARTGKSDTSKVLGDDGEGQPEGFKSIDRMFNAPEDFPGGAVLSPQDGIITSIQKASQGGNYIMVSGKALYAPQERRVTVKVGQKVTAGDALSDGVPNPSEVVEHKGIGEGRRYFCYKVTDILKQNGWASDRRNIESFTRSMLNKVEITNPDGYKQWLPGDLVNYSDIAAEWEPAENSKRLPADKALNSYLQEPILHYGIGTRVTPQVADTLSKYKMGDVLVSTDKPPFNATFVRAQSALQHDKHWLPRLSGERLQTALFDAAQQGITDGYDSTSYVDRIINTPYKGSI